MLNGKTRAENVNAFCKSERGSARGFLVQLEQRVFEPHRPLSMAV
jgi:hypothetical protein